MPMNNSKKILLSNITKLLEPDNEDIVQLTDLLLREDEKLSLYREASIDVVNSYHNEQKELLTTIQELVIVLSSHREYEADKTKYSEKHVQLLLDTGTEVLIKAERILNSH